MKLFVIVRIPDAPEEPDEAEDAAPVELPDVEPDRPAVETVIRLAFVDDLLDDDEDEDEPPKIRRGMPNDLSMLFFDWICSFRILMVRSAYGTRPR